MDDKKFSAVAKKQFADCQDILAERGKTYAVRNQDRLSAFGVMANLLDDSSVNVVLELAAKPIAKLFSLRKSRSKKLSSWQEYITDTINYLIILRAVLEEDENEQA